jgi:hypothetical protein
VVFDDFVVKGVLAVLSEVEEGVDVEVSLEEGDTETPYI